MTTSGAPNGIYDISEDPSLPSLKDGFWHHASFVMENGQLTIYRDGVPSNLVMATGEGTTGPLPSNIACGGGTTRFGFVGDESKASVLNGQRSGNLAVRGSIARLGYYPSVALTQQQIAALPSGFQGCPVVSDYYEGSKYDQEVTAATCRRALLPSRGRKMPPRKLRSRSTRGRPRRAASSAVGLISRPPQERQGGEDRLLMVHYGFSRASSTTLCAHHDRAAAGTWQGPDHTGFGWVEGLAS